MFIVSNIFNCPLALILNFVNLQQLIHEAQIYFVFCAMAKMPLAKWAEKEEALLQAFGLSAGLCGVANVLTTVRWLFSKSIFFYFLQIESGNEFIPISQ